MSEQVKKAPVKKAAVVTALSLKDVGLDGARKAVSKIV